MNLQNHAKKSSVCQKHQIVSGPQNSFGKHNGLLIEKKKT